MPVIIMVGTVVGDQGHGGQTGVQVQVGDLDPRIGVEVPVLDQEIARLELHQDLEELPEDDLC